jgi:hypothetical protein
VMFTECVYGRHYFGTQLKAGLYLRAIALTLSEFACSNSPYVTQ